MIDPSNPWAMFAPWLLSMQGLMPLFGYPVAHQPQPPVFQRVAHPDQPQPQIVSQVPVPAKDTGGQGGEPSQPSKPDQPQQPPKDDKKPPAEQWWLIIGGHPSQYAPGPYSSYVECAQSAVKVAPHEGGNWQCVK